MTLLASAAVFALSALNSNFALCEELQVPIENNFVEPPVNTNTSTSDVVVVPIGLIEWDMRSLTWGGLFGALGAILENAMAGDQQAQTSRSLSQTIESSTDPRRLLAQNLADAIKLCGRTAVASQDSFSTDLKPSEWRKSKSPKASQKFDAITPTGNYIEAGVQRFWIDKTLLGTYLHGSAQINVFDATGTYLDHFSDYSGLNGRVKLVGEPTSGSDAAVKEIEDGVKMIVSALAKTLGGKFCQLKK